MNAVEPGWYTDPGRHAAYRWWDGSAWTRWLSRAADVAAPPVDPAPSADQTPNDEAPDDTPAGRPVAEETAVGVPLAVVVLIGAVLLALLVVGGSVALTTDRLPSGPAVDPPAASPTTPVTPLTYDAATRSARVNEFHAIAAGAPFTCDPPKAQAGLFSSAVACNALVHAGRDGQDGWYASQLVGVLDASLVEPDDLNLTLDHLTEAVTDDYYPDVRVTVKKRKVSRLVGIAPDGRALLLSMELHYRAKGVPSTYDKMVIGLFHLEDGEYATWLAARPDDARTTVGKVLDASADTVSAQP